MASPGGAVSAGRAVTGASLASSTPAATIAAARSPAGNPMALYRLRSDLCSASLIIPSAPATATSKRPTFRSSSGVRVVRNVFTIVATFAGSRVRT